MATRKVWAVLQQREGDVSRQSRETVAAAQQLAALVDASVDVVVLGAARAVHLSNPAFLRGDALSTGRALAAAIAKEDCRLVFTGSQSDDLGYGSTG